jgi:hypothetical protein
MAFRSYVLGLCLITLAGAGCTKSPGRLIFGEKDKKNSPNGDNSPTSGDNSSSDSTGSQSAPQLIDPSRVDPDCQEPTASPSSIRTLTRGEYLRTASRVLDIDLAAADVTSELPRDSVVKGFRNISEANQMSLSRLRLYLNAGNMVAEQFMQQKPEAYNCGQAAGTCVDLWLSERLPLIWRKNISDEDITELKNFYNTNGADANAFQLMISRVLLSPNFLNLKEIGSNGKLTNFEIASGLAFALWGQGPDQSLLAAAEAGELSEESDLEAQIRRMIQDERFDFGLKRFLRSWLEVDRIHLSNNNEDSHPGFSEDIKAQIEESIFLNIRYLIDQGEDTYNNLFNLDFTFTSPQVAKLYSYQPHPDQQTFRDHTMYKLPAVRVSLPYRGSYRS